MPTCETILPVFLRETEADRKYEGTLEISGSTGKKGKVAFTLTCPLSKMEPVGQSVMRGDAEFETLEALADNEVKYTSQRTMAATCHLVLRNNSNQLSGTPFFVSWAYLLTIGIKLVRQNEIS